MPELVVEGREFADEDWYGEDMVDRVYSGCTFRRVDLTEATTRRVTFTGCTFANVRFNASRHHDTALVRCVIERSELFDAEFTGCKLTGSTITDCGTRPLRVTGGDWSFVTLTGADLRGVTFTDVRMREVDLSRADCTGATLTGVDLSAATLTGADLSGTDLRGSDLTALDPSAVRLSGAIIDADQAVVIAQALGLRIG
ncbi:pentapeptide repeat-containing protein [Polymorphospora sp. NPDC050346]|uniref:pentapeptide repeat-containing protein n=1 Tax=Polymorphospora sp. NPDC050346 TaxID=3155780 RepID=UPI0033C62B5E